MSSVPLLGALIAVIVIAAVAILKLKSSRDASRIEVKQIRKRMLVAVNALSVAMGIDEELVKKELQAGRPIDLNTMARIIQSGENFAEQITASNEIDEPAPEQ